MIVGVDTGGTFTDVVTARGDVSKVLSDPVDPSVAVARGVTARTSRDRVALLAHGTTVATNALLQGAVAKVALITTEGFEDVIEIGRQDRPSLYDSRIDRPPPLVPRFLRFGVPERVDASGRVLRPLRTTSLPSVPDDVEAVAISLLHADLVAEHEHRAAEYYRSAGFDVCASSEVSPEFREFERTVTTVANAALRPRCRDYLRRVGGLADEVLVMTSAGGLLPATTAAELPVALLLSGPAAGVQAAAAIASACGVRDCVTFDMGGTSTDVCLVRDGAPTSAASMTVGGYPIRMPSLDIHTIGAGGGSIAFLDPGGALRVGPASAGADPGPACYGRGGSRPTVTDADLLLGRIPGDSPLSELPSLDTEAARRAFEESGLDPVGVVRVVDTNMVQAVRRVTVERGVDPRDLVLVAFGGAGPLHACGVAEQLGMRAVIVPPRAGVLSAVGLLTSPRQRDAVRSWPTPDNHDDVDAALRALGDELLRAAGRDAILEVGIDCRYRGQSHELTVPDLAAFPDEHRRRNGFAPADTPIEVIAIRARTIGPAPVGVGDLPAVERQRTADGPSVLAESDTTAWLPSGWTASQHDTGAWILEPRA